jgi:hypothetical protein
MAIVSLIVGIITWVSGILFACPALLFTAGIGGLVCCPLSLVGGVAATVTGYLGRNQIRASGGEQTGDGLAVAGLILGGLGILASFLFLCVAIAEIAGVFTLPIAFYNLPLPTPRR